MGGISQGTPPLYETLSLQPRELWCSTLRTVCLEWMFEWSADFEISAHSPGSCGALLYVLYVWSGCLSGPLILRYQPTAQGAVVLYFTYCMSGVDV